VLSILAGHLPTVLGSSEYVDAGGLTSQGPNFPDLYRRAADFVDETLRSERLADMPIEQPTKFDLLVDVTADEALRLTSPTTFLARADELIE
jgi:putative tryptophan/tyrosine transport system substrate-binding protein